MAPSKSWMHNVDNRVNCEDYVTGVKKFVEYAIRKVGGPEIRCPCRKCMNNKTGTPETVESHLIYWGILRGYTFWYHHGERRGEPESEVEDEDGFDGGDNEENEEAESEDEMREMIRDHFPYFSTSAGIDGDIGLSSQEIPILEEPDGDAKTFYRLMEDCDKPLYEGCKTSKLSAIVKLLHIKTLGRWSNKSFTMLLEFLKEELLPGESLLPSSYYEAKKIIQDFGISYKKINACVKDCMLYWKEDGSLESCKKCGASRWKVDVRNGEVKCKANGKKISAKVLRYFPLSPRLQRLFMSTKTASLMRWHQDDRIKDGVMRHPADSKAWKSFDESHPSFSLEPRNVRLGLASDGFQPFTNMSSPYSIWPVILVPYNLPPWMCMKPSNFILSMLIPGPDAPGDAIDVYLQPLIEELKELWESGIQTFDASLKQNFILHAALLWTINDFPAYGNLSGWSTKGKLACPNCHKYTHSLRLTNGCKQCYMGHRRYLKLDHKWRKNKESFDGTQEFGVPPKPLSGVEVLDQVEDLEGAILSRDPQIKTKVSHDVRGDNWNKKSVFFKLSYWKTLLLRHNLDVMHIEKNICDSLLLTIMNINGKMKDTLKTRLDLQAMNIRPDLHPIQRGNKLVLPPASYTLGAKEKELFYKFLKNLKVPDGFSSNLSHCVNLKEHKLLGMKSHDFHVLLQHLLPVALRGLVPDEVYEPIAELSSFFSILCAKALKMDNLDQIGAQIGLTLCKLEKILPPSCFDIMMHLPVHLAHEAMNGGPVYFRWMYPVECQIYIFKSYIRNRAHPEGSIAEGYIADECMTLCSRYIHSIETKFNHLERNYDGGPKNSKKNISIFFELGRPLGAARTRDLDLDDWVRAHIYVLKNCDEVQPFLE